MKTLKVFLAVLSVLAFGNSSVSYAQQWNGPENPTGRIWRPGYIAIGGEPSKGNDPRAVLDVKLPAGDLDDLFFRASFLFQDSPVERFEVDRHRAYAGGARSKAAILPGDYDFAVHRSAAIGVVNINDHIPGGYKLVVGGKMLAEEVRIKLVNDWGDYVFEPDYRLKSLLEVEEFVRTHRHLPDIPSAADVGERGVDLGHMQSKLLVKIEELTLYLIEQNKAIDSLLGKVTQLEQENASLKPQPVDDHSARERGERISR